MIYPKTLFHRRRAAALIARRSCFRELQVYINLVLKHLQIFGPFALPFHRLPFTWELS